ncbi:hypothetical protein BpHYR1_013065 [Brachionus plicatilis]|uniref:Uncharacterized protein n=1 Tax=Brachionus plicatilis TaxID=10195 RepID=A0A3M7RTV1_BRAPC|nr:hypothetical protein BpHYR1_013065 [Brachionus plicatilis]
MLGDLLSGKQKNFNQWSFNYPNILFLKKKSKCDQPSAYSERNRIGINFFICFLSNYVQHQKHMLVDYPYLCFIRILSCVNATRCNNHSKIYYTLQSRFNLFFSTFKTNFSCSIRINFALSLFLSLKYLHLEIDIIVFYSFIFHGLLKKGKIIFLFKIFNYKENKNFSSFFLFSTARVEDQLSKIIEQIGTSICGGNRPYLVS